MISCSLETVARPALNLRGAGVQALARNHETLTVGHAVETLRALYPGLKMGMIDSPDPRRGWIEPSGRSVINLRHAGLDTPFHEAAHLWEAVLNNALPAAQYDNILDELADTPYAERSAQLYPELDERAQLREALVQLLGEQAAAALRADPALAPGRSQGLRALARRVWARLRPVLDPLLGPAAADEPALTARTLGDVLSQGVEALVRTPSPHLVPKIAAQLLRGTLDQRAPTAPSIQNPRHLLEFIAGQDASTSVKHIESRASNFLAKAEARKGPLYFELDAENNPLNKKQKYPIKGKTKEERLKSVVDTLTKLGQAHRQQLTADALDFFKRPEAERARLLRGDFGKDGDILTNGGRDLTEEQREQRRLYYQEMQNLFPTFQPGDEVVLYTKENAGELYHPAVDSGSLVLHRQKVKDAATGNEKTQVALASLTDGPLDETAKHRSFLAGIYDPKGLSGVFNSLAVRFGNEIKLSNTHENRQKMQVLLAGMHLRSLGYEVTALSVGKFDKMSSRKNQVRRMFPTEHLQVMEKLAALAPVRQALQASGESGQYLLSLLDKPELRVADNYCQDYVEFLSQQYQQAGPNAEAVRQALGTYYAQKSATSLLALNQAIQRRQRQLIRQSNWQGNPEFVMLGNALVQLAGIKHHLNPWHVIDAATEKITSFLRSDNPIMQYFVKRWDDSWYLVSQQFMAMQDEHQRVTSDLHDYYQKHHALVGAREHLAEASQAKYYDNLFQRQEVDWHNPKTDQIEKRSINTYKLILPTSAEFQKLAGPEQAYIRWALKTVKARVLAVERMKREQSGEPTKEPELEKWYQDKWGDGRVPVIQAGIWQSVLKGDLAYATEEHLRQLFEDNPRFHDQQQDQEDRLNDYLLTQGDDQVRAKVLGLEPDDEDSKKLQLRGEDGDQVQNRIEGDMRRVMNVFLMQTLKHEMQQDLEVDTKVGIALIRNHEHLSGLLRHAGQLSVGTDGETTSQTEQMFLKMARQLWLGRKNQGKGHGLEKGLYTALAAAGSLATSTILLANVMVPVQSFLSQTLGTLLPQALARQGFTGPSAAPTASNVAAAIKEVTTASNWDKLEAMAKQLGVTRHGEYDLLGLRQHTGEPFRVFSGETFYSLDRWGENVTRMAVMVAMLKQQGVYDCYGWDAAKKTLTYDVARDRKARGDKTVDVLHENLVKEGVLKEGQPLDRAYDGRLRRTMEMVLVDVMGGYSPLGQTTLGATAGGNIVRRLAGFLPARVERAMQGRHQSENRGDYKDGEFVHEEEVGQVQSWLKLLGLMWQESGGLLSRYQKVKAGSDLSSADQLNLRMINANLAMTAMFATASYAATAALSDEEKRRKRTVALRLLDSMIMETFAFENFRMLLGKAASPVIELAMMKNMLDGINNVYMPGGDAKRGWHQITSRVGLLRTADLLKPADK